MGSPFEVSGAVHLQPALVARLEHEACASQGQAITALRIENFTKSVAYRKEQLKEPAQGLRRASTSSIGENSLHFWGELRRLSVLQRQRRAGVAHLHLAHRRPEGGGRHHRLHGLPRLLRLVGRA